MINLDYTRTNKFYPKQLEFINCEKQYAFCMGSNKCGKTDPLCIYLLEQSFLIGKEGRFFCWLSPVSSQAEIAFNNCNLHLKKAKIINLCKINRSKITITMPNLAVIRFVGSERPDYVWGYQHYSCVVDEASHVKEESWKALRTTVYYTKGKIRCIGNPTTKHTWFYRDWLRAKNGEYDNGAAFKLNSFDAVEAGFLDLDFILSEQKNLTKQDYQRNILAEVPSDSDINPFGNISNIIRDYNIKEIGDKEVFCFGVDLAKSVDWTVIIGLNKDGVLVYFNRFQNSWELTKEKILATVGDIDTLVDSTGVGDPILESLQKEKYTIEGYKYSNTTKVHLIETLAIIIQQGEITIPNNDILIAELENFETQTTPRGAITYNAGSGHDDCVNSLALCTMLYKRKTENQDLPFDYFINWDKYHTKEKVNV